MHNAVNPLISITLSFADFKKNCLLIHFLGKENTIDSRVVLFENLWIRKCALIEKGYVPLR